MESGSDEPRRSASPTFDEFVQARWAALFRTAHLLTGDRDAGEDLLQNTLVKAYTRWERVTRADAPEAYVRKMLLNEFIDDCRRRSRRSVKDRLMLVNEEPTDSPDPSQRLDLWSLLGSLSPRERAVLVLRYYEDLTESHIATVLGIAPGTVKSYASSALRTLRARHEAVHIEHTREVPQ